MKIRTDNLTHARLLAVLHYDPETGVFKWLQALSPRGLVGTQAGGVRPDGYRTITIDGKPYLAHRLAWFYVHGQWPSYLLDHRDGLRDDNRISELRDADWFVNNQNRHVAMGHSQTKLLGAFPVKGSDRFESRICLAGKSKYLGRFDTPEEAHQAYLAAKRIHHPGSTL